MDPITTDPNVQLTEADKIQARLQKGSPLIKKKSALNSAVASNNV